MKSPDPRDFGLNRFQCVRLQKCLQPGERLYWAGQPVIRHFETDRVNRVVGVLFFSLFGLFGAVMLYFLWQDRVNTDSMMGEILSWVMAIVFFMVPIVACIIAPRLHAARLRSTVYVITNRRAIVCGWEVKSWPLEPDMVFSNDQARDGCGNLVFGFRYDEGVGFMDIRDVRLVEEILEKAIAERENS